MTIRAETVKLIESVELHAGRKMKYAAEVGELLDCAHLGGRLPAFEDLTFQAKFAIKTLGVMKRIGSDGEGYEKLATEFGSSLEKVSTLLKELVNAYPQEDGQKFHATFLAFDQESLSKLLDLLGDLALVKNWSVDGHSLA